MTKPIKRIFKRNFHKFRKAYPKIKRYFLHIFRAFSARVVFGYKKVGLINFLLAVLSFIFLLNIAPFFLSTTNQSLKNKLLVSLFPQNPKFLLNLGQNLFDQKSYEEAKTHLLLARKFCLKSAGCRLLSPIDSLLEKTEENIQKPIVLRTEITKWEKIVVLYPDFRDGYLKLSDLYYQLGQKSLARLFVDKALQLDPYFDKAKILKAAMEKIP